MNNEERHDPDCECWQCVEDDARRDAERRAEFERRLAEIIHPDPPIPF